MRPQLLVILSLYHMSNTLYMPSLHPIAAFNHSFVFKRGDDRWSWSRSRSPGLPHCNKGPISRQHQGVLPRNPQMGISGGHQKRGEYEVALAVKKDTQSLQYSSPFSKRVSLIRLVMESDQWNVAAKQDVQLTHCDSSTMKAQLSIVPRLVRLPVSWLCTAP